MNTPPIPLAKLRWFLLAVLIACWNVPGAEVRHYVFFGFDRERVSDAAFLGTKRFQGAQLKYSWRELEPEPDVYDSSAIEHDLGFLTSKGKRLFLQLQDVTFDPAIINVPKYLLNDPRYGGGAAKQYTLPDDDEARAVPEGWIARRWDSAVQERFHRLIAALGRQFDGRIEGINLAETAVSFGESGRLYPKGFSPSSYRDAILTNMLALKRSFPKSATMQYANFMPGEWLPDDDRGYLRSVYEEAERLKVGVGGPDLLPFRRGQLAHAYPLIRASAGIVPTGIAVQEGNYASVNPKTGKRVSIQGLIGFATEHLKVDYIFWCNEEPFYSRDLIPFLQGSAEASEQPIRESARWLPPTWARPDNDNCPGVGAIIGVVRPCALIASAADDASSADLRSLRWAIFRPWGVGLS